MQAEPINDALKGHAEKAPWNHAALARDLYTWAERFNVEFKLNVTAPAIAIDRDRTRFLGTYREGRDGYGIRDRITMNTAYLDRPYWEVLRTLLHELLHQWQAVHGKTSRTAHHNREFREKARTLGLIVDAKGVTSHEPGPFTALLDRHGVQVGGGEPVVAKPPQRPGSKLKKWSCGCTNVRVAVELSAVCRRCGKDFKRN